MKMFFGVGSQSIGHFSGFTQQTNGAVTMLDGVSLGAPMTVRDISGDATYAMGRWAAGAVTGLTSPVTLTESSNAAFHYVVFNAPASMPTSGTLSCDTGTFTTPSWVGGTNVASADNLGRVTGTAQLSFSGNGAAVQLVLNVANSAGSGANNFSTTIAPGASSAFAGHSIGTAQPGAFVALSASGAAYDVVGGYMANTSNSAQYTGTFRFHCK
jgi:hypothetical protein